MKIQNTPEELEIVRKACRESLYYLCTRFFAYEDWDKVHDDLGAFIKRPSKRKMILIPRGHLKTAVVTKAYSIQCLLRDPNCRVLIANQVWDKAREMLHEIKEYLEDKSPLPILFGQFKSDRWNQDEVVIRQRKKALSAPSIGTTGVEAEMTSTHYDVIIADDLQGLQNIQTKDQRDKVKKFYRSLVDLLEPGGQMIVVGTRWSLDDLYQEIMDRESDFYDIMVRRIVENGRLIFPKKFNKKFDKEMKTWVTTEETTFDYVNYLKASKDNQEFNAQYLNDPIDEEHQIFKKEFFQNWKQRPDGLYVVTTVDPAISIKEQADYTAIVTCGMDKEYNIYVLDYIRGHWTPSEIIENMMQAHNKWNPNVVGLETIGFQKTLKYALDETMRHTNVHFPVQEIRGSNQISKELRIKALEPYYREKKVFHASWMRDMEDELYAFPRGKRDDLIDALSMQLDLLLPGGVETNRTAPMGSWEFYATAARKANMPYRYWMNS